MTIAQIVHDNERYFGYSEEDIHAKVRPLSVTLTRVAADLNIVL